MSYNFETIQAAENFTETSVRHIAQTMLQSMETNDHCTIGLSGGSTPGPVYELLGQQEGIDWAKVHVFLVDDRYVPADHADSNQRLARETLLKHADIPEQNFCAPNTELPLEDCIADFGENLSLLPMPADLLILGMGPDGHITSLFPPVPEHAFDDATLALHTQTDVFAVHDRITVSPLLIASARAHILLLKGQEKHAVFHECVSAEMNPVRWPLHLALAGGNLTAVLG